MQAAVLNALRLIRHPVPVEKQRLMQARWSALDPRLRTPGQGFGRQATGCGATIGIHPGCDFACTGCYLGADANHARPVGRDEAFRQLERLRAWLGPKGNTQITDGEVTLLPPGELIAIIRYARHLGLIPMVMTHGDSFRRRRGLLERLMVEGGLTEVSIHIDTTQRGRVGYRQRSDERALDALREECATMIRAARRTTGLPLRAATTATITHENLDGVAGLVDWCVRNRDAFGMLSLQPVARVGRTLHELETATVPAIWERIESALRPYGVERHGRSVLSFGHPDCTRIELFAVYEREGEPPRLVEIVREGSPRDVEMLEAFFERGLGGINFRDDTVWERLCRGAGILLTDPRWILGPLRRWAAERVALLGTTASRLAWDTLRRKARVDSFAVVTHHFMSADELTTPAGRERLDACLFRVPVGDGFVPMCRVNAGGVREAFYGGPAAP